MPDTMDEKSKTLVDQSAPDSSESINNTDPKPHGGELNNGTGEEKTAPALGEQRSIHGIKWVLAVAAILSSTFLFALDTTVVS